MKHLAFATAFALASLFTVGARAEMMKFHAMLNTATEVPPKTGNGTGMLDATLDTSTKMLTYTLTFSGLSGPATMEHFHGPAAPGANAGVLVPIAGEASPIKGSAKLTDAQIADLEAGKVYVNVHTKANPGGEIRGQVMSGAGM
jgi:hypothetical protein